MVSSAYVQKTSKVDMEKVNDINIKRLRLSILGVMVAMMGLSIGYTVIFRVGVENLSTLEYLFVLLLGVVIFIAEVVIYKRSRHIS
jgi:TRAP-type C4-dicarboxylate transport system permease small subunit